MNARHTRSIRTAILILFGAILLTTAQSATLAQGDTHLMAVRYFEGIAGVVPTANAKAAPALVSSHSMLHTPEGSYAGADGPARFGAVLQQSFSELVFTTQRSEDVGDYVIAEFMLTGIHTGTYAGLAPDCARIAVPGMAILEEGDAGITEQWISYDQQAVVDQIHVFSLFNPDGRAGCGESAPVMEQLPKAIAPAGAPACTSANRCEMPY